MARSGTGVWKRFRAWFDDPSGIERAIRKQNKVDWDEAWEFFRDPDTAPRRRAAIGLQLLIVNQRAREQSQRHLADLVVGAITDAVASEQK